MEGNEKLRKFLRLKSLLPISLAVIITVVLLRTVQFYLAIDPVSGFFDPNNIIAPLITIVIVGYLIYVIALLIGYSARIDRPYRLRYRTLTAIFSIITGFVLAAEGLIQLFGGAAQAGQMSTIGMFCVMMRLVSGGVFCYQAYLFYDRAGEQQKQHNYFAFVAIWALLDLAECFLQTTAVADISASVYDLLFSVSLLMFMVYYAEYTAGLIGDRQKNYIMVLSVSTTILGAVSILPPFVYKLIGNQATRDTLNWPSFGRLALTVFVGWIAYLFMQETLHVNGWNQPTKKVLSLPSEHKHKAVRTKRFSATRKRWVK